jgi:hypothetical protein
VKCNAGCFLYLIFLFLILELNNWTETAGVYFKKALFVPGLSMYHKIGSHALTPSDSNIDLSWQFTLQRVWENLMQGNKGIV